MARRIKFANPPINELVIGAYFDPPIQELRAEHIGLFWNRIRHSYPNAQQQAPIGSDLLFAAEVFPLPRFWFTSEDDSTVLQLQKNALLFNWRKRAGTYPHFEKLKQEFDSLFYLYADFLKSELKVSQFTIAICELTYINIIEAGEYWRSPLDTSSVIPSFHHLGAPPSGDVTPDFNYTSAFKISEDMTMSVNLKNGRKADSASVLLWELKASGRVNATDFNQTEKWYARAHDVIGQCFLDSSSREVQTTYWKPS